MAQGQIGEEIMTMSPELRARWSAALREEDRVQGRGALCAVTPDGVRHQCCLDVLIDLYQADHPDAPLTFTTLASGVVAYVNDSGYRETSVLPEKVADWARTGTSPCIGPYGAAYLNDSMGATFLEIADRIDDLENLID